MLFEKQNFSYETAALLFLTNISKLLQRKNANKSFMADGYRAALFYAHSPSKQKSSSLLSCGAGEMNRKAVFRKTTVSSSYSHEDCIGKLRWNEQEKVRATSGKKQQKSSKKLNSS